MKQSKIFLSETLIDQFLVEIDKFPSSTKVSPVNYDAPKLMSILREKEVTEICKVSKADLDLVNQIDTELSRVAKDIVREIDLDQSLKDYRDFEARMEKAASGNLFLYAKQCLLSVKALYHYKMKNWEMAVAATLECIALIDYLVQLGIVTLNLRMLEQNKNISKIYLRSGAFDLGYGLLFKMFDYMLNGIDGNLHGNSFKDRKFWKNEPVLRESYACQTFIMITEYMIKCNLTKDAYFPDDWYKNLDFEVDNVNRQVIYNWIFLNNQLRREEYEEFFDNLIYFFNEPIGEYYDVLKVSLLLDVNKLINQSNCVPKNEATEKIKHFIQNKLSTLEKLRGKVIDQCFPFVRIAS